MYRSVKNKSIIQNAMLKVPSPARIQDRESVQKLPLCEDFNPFPSFISLIECLGTRATAIKYASAGDTLLCHMLLTELKEEKAGISGLPRI